MGAGLIRDVGGDRRARPLSRNTRGAPTEMRLARSFPGRGMMAVLVMFLGMQATAWGQEIARRQEPTANPGRSARSNDESIKAIDDDYARQLLGLERRRLASLERLAAQQKPVDAAATYEKLFRLAIAANLFGDAEPAAKAVLGAGSPSQVALGLAYTVKIVAEADRGAYEQSLQTLEQAVADREAGRGGPARVADG